MPLSQSELDELARAPKQVSVDGQTVVERDAADVLAINDDAAEQAASNKTKLPIRFMNTRPPGAT